MAGRLADKNSIKLHEAAEQFLAQPTFAVFGLSSGHDDSAKTIYEKLKASGRKVVAIHPTKRVVKGIICWPSLHDSPYPIHAIVVVTRPEHTHSILTNAKKQGVYWAWIHKSFGSSVDPLAVNAARAEGMQVIDGGCPMMFVAPVDKAHACFKHLLQWVKRVPKTIEVVS